jgi:hypothetical protein
MVPIASSGLAKLAARAGLVRFRKELLLALALAGLTFAVFRSVLDYEFVDYDDDVYVTNNLGVQGGLTLDGIAWALSATRSNHWHPLTWMSLQLDVDLFGLSPRGFHLTNLVLHIANVVLLFGILTQMTGYAGRSAAVAALFAVHPLRVESVAWVTERKDVLSTFLWLVTTGAYVSYTRRPSWRRYLCVLVLLVLGLMAKPMLMTLPLTLLLLDWWPLRRFAPARYPSDFVRSNRGLIREKVPFIALGVASGVVSLVAQKLGGGLKSGEYVSPGERMELAVSCVVVYLHKTIWPVNLAPYYPLPPGGPPAAQVAAAAALIIVLTLGALAVERRHPYLTVGWLWYLVTLIPTTGVVQLGNYSYADRYTYVPSIGLYLAAVWWAAEVFSRSGRATFVRATVAVLVLTLAFLSWRQVPIWHHNIALWEHAKRVTPDNYFMRTHLGLSYQRAGRLKEAEAELAAAVELRPDMALVRDNLGLLLLVTGRPIEAEAQFREALARDPPAARYRLHLVEALKHQGRLQAAEEEFRALTETSPGG